MRNKFPGTKQNFTTISFEFNKIFNRISKKEMEEKKKKFINLIEEGNNISIRVHMRPSEGYYRNDV